MRKFPGSTKFLVFAFISSLVIASCGASSFITDDLDLQLVSQKSSGLKKAASIFSGLLWAVVAGGSIYAIADAFMHNTNSNKLIQGGVSVTALLVSLYKLGFFDANNNGYPHHHSDCSCDCHDHYHNCSCYDDSCCNHAFCCDHCEREENVHEQKEDNIKIETVIIETVSDYAACNDQLTDFWEDPFNY